MPSGIIDVNKNVREALTFPDRDSHIQDHRTVLWYLLTDLISNPVVDWAGNSS